MPRGFQTDILVSSCLRSDNPISIYAEFTTNYNNSILRSLNTFWYNMFVKISRFFST